MPELDRPEVADEIRRLQVAWMEAWRTGDRATLERVLAPEFALVVSAAPDRRVSRDAWLSTALTDYRCTAFRYRHLAVRDFGAFVVVSSVGEQQATAFGMDRSGAFFLTDVWQPSTGGGTWQVVARYSSHPEPSGPSVEAMGARVAEMRSDPPPATR